MPDMTITKIYLCETTVVLTSFTQFNQEFKEVIAKS